MQQKVMGAHTLHRQNNRFLARASYIDDRLLLLTTLTIVETPQDGQLMVNTTCVDHFLYFGKVRGENFEKTRRYGKRQEHFCYCYLRLVRGRINPKVSVISCFVGEKSTPLRAW